MDNPLLRPWAGPHGGVPPFGEVRIAHFEPALEAAMAEQLAEIERIAADPAPPTFANTLEALEGAGRTLSRVAAVYNVYAGTLSSDEFKAIERTMAPKLAAVRDRIVQNEALFRRIAAVYEARESSGLNAEQQRLAWHRYTDFVRSGARLDAVAKERLANINQRLASLYTRFSQNVLADEEVSIDDARGTSVPNTRSSVEPFLAFSPDRAMRERVWRAFTRRGDNGDARDNKATILEVLRLRRERANLLGYPTHAHWRLEKSMARTPERANALLEALWKPALARAREEVADMQAVADAEGAGIRIEPWDYRYYAEKVRKAKYDLDENEVKPYLQLERLRDGMFWVAGQLLGWRFLPRPELPRYHEDVGVWEVVDREGAHVGLFYFDPHARPGKRSGAWMNAYRPQEAYAAAVTPIVSNNSNFVKPAPGAPVLVSWSDARTLFHEFGHGLHGLASRVAYPSLAGTAVDRDFVEFPSQLLEHWLATREVLDRFALHHESGEPMPAALLGKLERAARFNQGFDTVEYLSSAIVDLRLHLADPASLELSRFEEETLAEIGMPREIAMRHRLPHFGHLFSSDAYSAGYYSYLWADTLVADAFEAFTEAGGAYDPATARRLHEAVLSRGNTVDAEAAYQAFRGREASLEALMRKRGFAASPRG
jgi:peptidyl-dipeptidase Dcp